MTDRSPHFSRRDLLRAALPATLALAGPAWSSGEERKQPVARPITRGPKFHWFGYYDKLQFDASGRRVLGMEVDFEHRSPRADDTIRLGLVDLDDGDRWSELGTSRAWGWQQGCMLQWRPGHENEVFWNDRDGDRFVCRILNVATGARRTIPHPVYAVSPDGLWGVTPDFRRINDMRPGYGYAGLADPNRDVLAPADSGIWRVNLETGQAELIVSIADVARIPFKRDISRAKHYFNHLLVSPDGARFIFLHRWGEPVWTGETRMFTVGKDGSDLRVIDDSGATSHFIWRDPRTVLAWSWHASHRHAFYLFDDQVGGAVRAVDPEAMPVNGHCTYLPRDDNAWILNDAYPDAQRLQHLYLYHVPTRRRTSLGSFLSPREYQGEWRCDLHPRSSRDGRLVSIDSTHNGQGRQMFLLDLGALLPFEK